MAEKLFLICEVVEDEHNHPYKNFKFYRPVDETRSNKHGDGCLFRLEPDRIIPASRLRYGTPEGETAFDLGKGWAVVTCKFPFDQYLILDPPPEKRDEWLLG